MCLIPQNAFIFSFKPFFNSSFSLLQCAQKGTTASNSLFFSCADIEENIQVFFLTRRDEFHKLTRARDRRTA